MKCLHIALARLQRIGGYDQRSGVNSIRVVNPQLSEQAAAKDAELYKVSLASKCSLKNKFVMKTKDACMLECSSGRKEGPLGDLAAKVRMGLASA